MEKKRIRMIGLDLDGTLLNGQKQITAYTERVLDKAIAQGVVVLVATGRPVMAVPSKLREKKGMPYILTANGARILDQEKNQIIYENLMQVETARNVLDIFKQYDTIHEVFLDGRGYTCREGLERVYEFFQEKGMAEYLRSTRTPVENVIQTLEERGQKADKVHAVFRNLEERREALLRLQEVEDIDVTAAFGNTIEVNRKGTNKGIGLIRLGERLQIPREEIMAFGDGMNDYQMLKEVGFGVAMENGHARVKEVADYVTLTNEEDGVAKAIEKFVIR